MPENAASRGDGGITGTRQDLRSSVNRPAPRLGWAKVPDLQRQPAATERSWRVAANCLLRARYDNESSCGLVLLSVLAMTRSLTYVHVSVSLCHLVRFRCVRSPGGEGEITRKRIASEVLHEALEALRDDIDIAIYDATNTTPERRKWLSDAVASSGLHVQVRIATSKVVL